MELNFGKMAYDMRDAEMEAQIAVIHQEAMEVFWKKNPNLSEEEKSELSKPFKVTLTNALRRAGGNANKFSIKLNYRLLKVNPNVLKEVYVHELAHVLSERLHAATGEKGMVGHGHKWKVMMLKLGQVPNTRIQGKVMNYLPEPKKRNLIG